MDDLRQKLFPIFLKEAERILVSLRQFLSYEDLSLASADELEAAFRAAHTLKGTANLVQAESICKIARRLEAMLEKHFEARTRPTPVEHEALKLAVDWLAPLLSALQGDLQEPKLFVAEALQALDLAEAFPGRTPLVELLDSHSEQRSPLLDDPFAGDPDLLPEEEMLMQAERDPFADDPSFGMEINMVSPAAEEDSTDGADQPEIIDPFADDYDFPADDLQAAATDNDESVDAVISSAADLPYDPFADDVLGLDVDSVSESVVTEKSFEPAELIDNIAELQETVVVAEPEATVETETVALDDPFADDEDFIAEVEVDLPGEESPDRFSTSTVTVAERAEKIAESLLLPQETVTPRREYACCVFSIGGHDYHLPIRQMMEIADLPQLLPLPLAPPMVSGLINLRGQVMPVINLAVLNQHQQSEVRLQRRLVVGQHQHETIAFLVDGVPYLSEDFTGEKVDMSKFLSLYRLRGVE